jgi:hypothetical protein
MRMHDSIKHLVFWNGTIRFYLGDKTELIRELEQLKIELKMARKQNELYEEKLTQVCQTRV